MVHLTKSIKVQCLGVVIDKFSWEKNKQNLKTNDITGIQMKDLKNQRLNQLILSLYIMENQHTVA